MLLNGAWYYDAAEYTYKLAKDGEEDTWKCKNCEESVSVIKFLFFIIRSNSTRIFKGSITNAMTVFKKASLF